MPRLAFAAATRSGGADEGADTCVAPTEPSGEAAACETAIASCRG